MYLVALKSESFHDLLLTLKFENLPREELVATLGTDINPRLEMILVFLPSPKCREHLVLVEKLLSLPTKQQEAHTTTTRTVQYYPNCRI